MDTIGKFEVIEKIGEGGFGVVYLGLDPHIKRRVAIKTCTSEDQEIRDRFFQEARIAGNLHHRNVVTVYDFGLRDEIPYLVQEYLTGEDLDRKIKRKEYIPFPEKLHYLIQIARGLEYAHAQGVIHRDIKPANMRILDDGTVKIMDFGIAKLANQETGLTQTGMTLGTASYLAPEQIRGEPVDPRTDIFSYGALAYELLAFQRPFAGQHISTVLYQILNEDPQPVSEVAPDCPFELAAVVARCLERDPARRYPTCTELLEDLTLLVRQRRSLHDSGVGPLAAELSETEVPPTSSRTTVPSGMSARAAAGPHGDSDLADFELYSPVDSPLTPRSISTTGGVDRGGSRWGRWLAALAVIVAAGATAWWLLQPSTAPPGQLEGSAGLAEMPSKTAAATDRDASPHTETVVATPSDTEGARAESPELAPSMEELLPGPEQARDPDPEEETLHTPPPPPPPTILVVPRAWSPAITVRVDGTQHRLDRELRLELDPGRYTLQFAIVEGGYRDFESMVVTVGEGDEHRVAVPLLPPGALRIQPGIGTPAGVVFLGEELLGTVPPILERRLRPGQYTLEVRREGGAGEPLTQRVEVVPGRRTVATFDLAGGRWAVPPPRPLN